MKSHATASVTKNSVKTHAAKFAKVRDGRKQPIRGLEERNGRFYARLSFEDADTGIKAVRRVPLVDKDQAPVSTVAEAVTALNRLKTNREDNDLPVLTRTPKFSDYVTTYLDFVKSGAEGEGAMKKPGTIKKEEYTLGAWKNHLGTVPLDKIRPPHVKGFIAKRLKDGISKRTVALDVITLRNVLNEAIEDGFIKVLPIQQMRRSLRRRLKEKGVDKKNAKRDLLTAADLDILCNAALAMKEDGTPVTKNGKQFADYLRFMAFSGTRRNEALGTQWDDIDLKAGKLTVARQVTSRGIESVKSGEGRTVDLNAKLKTLLEDMKERRAPDSIWLFPSPQRGEKDIPAKSFRESLDLVREQIKKEHPKLAKKAFHDLRHHFISYCVMSGIDFMTIADWAGHQDGGVLIGKVYGHLANEHRKAMAEKVNFGPVAVKEVAA